MAPVCLSSWTSSYRCPLSPSLSSSLSFLYLWSSFEAVLPKPDPENQGVSHNILENSCLPGQAPPCKCGVTGSGVGSPGAFLSAFGEGLILPGLNSFTSEQQSGWRLEAGGTPGPIIRMSLLSAASPWLQTIKEEEKSNALPAEDTNVAAKCFGAESDPKAT